MSSKVKMHYALTVTLLPRTLINRSKYCLMIIQVLNSKLGVTLCVSVTSATILTAKKTIQKIHKHGLNHEIVLITKNTKIDVIETRNVIPNLEFKTCMTIKS